MLPGVPKEALLALASDKGYMRCVLDRVIERAGGEDRMVEIASASNEGFMEFVKLRIKLEPKHVNVSADRSVEQLVIEYEQAKNIQDGEFTPVTSVAVNEAS